MCIRDSPIHPRLTPPPRSAHSRRSRGDALLVALGRHSGAAAGGRHQGVGLHELRCASAAAPLPDAAVRFSHGRQ
eukprot:12755836-Alexandrium_andersonii.AAC.1